MFTEVACKNFQPVCHVVFSTVIWAYMTECARIVNRCSNFRGMEKAIVNKCSSSRGMEKRDLLDATFEASRIEIVGWF